MIVLGQGLERNTCELAPRTEIKVIYLDASWIRAEKTMDHLP